ncbi:hypothetical protein QP400_00670 [Winkia sp. UMB3158]|uniref:Uncharacterized protein n=1 Tax=Winkia neuii BV029A5 TaxID=888439 RepID=K0YV17_9ACTO|nr:MULTISPECIES: hypothetical protein [Winkia]MDK8342297.1 hypothetical protein [Winkia sp. UMB3164B]EJZ87383.1 hypothetical protein HMPREF9240_00732 [Winkia neuii BV029A5]MDK6240119.1 hypothetical protein [Winkia sp. UMB10116]MDK7148646.1 hypothetical protein [Winkia sp. UMB3158]MDK7905406.1 hypothetical protein [Winkia sp. UMB0889B]
MRDWVKDILVSPSSGNKLEEQDGYLVDVASGEAYPIRDEVPLLLISEQNNVGGRQ